MPLTDVDRTVIDRFRKLVETRFAGDPRFRAAQRHDRDDGAALAHRFEVAPQLWMELCLRPAIPQLRAGIVTDDRWKSEELEQVIEDSGDTMSEFVEMGFEEAGLDWPAPIVEHARDQGKYFYFATAFEIPTIAALDDDSVQQKIFGVLEGYYRAFRPAFEKQTA